MERAEDVRPAIQGAFAHDGPALIDFVTDPRALSMPPKTTVAQVKGMALSTRLVADALTLDDFAVRHLLDRPPGVPHKLSAAASVTLVKP